MSFSREIIILMLHIFFLDAECDTILGGCPEANIFVSTAWRSHINRKTGMKIFFTFKQI